MFLMEKEILYVQNPYQYLTRYFSDIPVDKELKKNPLRIYRYRNEDDIFMKTDSFEMLHVFTAYQL